MFNYFKNSNLIFFIFFYMLPSVYAMEIDKQQANNALLLALYTLSKSKPDLNIPICQSLLEHNANPNMQIQLCPESQTPLFIATQKDDSNANELIKLLIQYGANFTNKEIISLGWSKFYKCTPLASAIIYNNTPTIETLCDAGAPLMNMDEHGNTAFHVAINVSRHQTQNNKKANIKAIIQHSYFDSDKKVNPNKLLQKKFTLILSLFKKANLHEDTQLHIFANLPEFFIFFSSLRTTLIKRDYLDVRILSQVYCHVDSLLNILQTKNNHSQTALELYQAHGGDQSPPIKALLSGEKLKKDYEIFAKTFPQLDLLLDENLVLPIYTKYRKLHSNSSSKSTQKFLKNGTT